jgi:hypothetical protein
LLICAGAVDGILIPIQAPKENEAAYVCRKISMHLICKLFVKQI